MSCMACGDTKVNSKGFACAACIANVGTGTQVIVKEKEIPLHSIVRRDTYLRIDPLEYGIVVGHKEDYNVYKIAVVVNSKHVDTQVWERESFHVVKTGN